MCTFRFASVELSVRCAFLPCGRDQISLNIWTSISNLFSSREHERMLSCWCPSDWPFEGPFGWHDLSNFSICWIWMSHRLIVHNAWWFCVCIESSASVCTLKELHGCGRRPYPPLNVIGRSEHWMLKHVIWKWPSMSSSMSTLILKHFVVRYSFLPCASGNSWENWTIIS